MLKAFRARALGLGVCVLFVAAGGCAGIPLVPTSSSSLNTPSVERDHLAEAVRAVKVTPWPAPEKVSFASRITGAKDEKRVTRSDAIEAYLDTLQPMGARFPKLAGDARANLAAADALLAKADNARHAQRLSMNDVAIIEGAIQALRENGQIYVAAAKVLEKSGEPVDRDQLADIRTAYRDAVKALGESADAVADQVSRRQDETYAAPEKSKRLNFSGAG